jgi:phenylacetate-CoA ligase
MPGTFAERIYYRLPVTAQNAVFSLYGLKTSRERYNKHFEPKLTWLKESDWWDKQQIRTYQDQKLREIVAHAAETVPFYQRYWNEHGVRASDVQGLDDLHRLPVLTKTLARQHLQHLISTSYAKSKLFTTLSSGTSGSPIRVRLSPEGLAFQWAVWWRHKARFGITRKHKALMFGARVPIAQNQQEPPFWRRDLFGNRVYLSTYHIKEENVRAIVKMLNAERFEYFTGYPSAMAVLAGLIEQTGVELRSCPKHIVSGSDALLPTFEKTLTRVFRAPVTENYGMAEFAGNMAKCEQGHFHLDFECCAVEEQAIDAVDENQTNLLFTGWGNPAMPFIRYEIGDHGRALGRACSCGRASCAFAGIDGRTEDCIITSDGRAMVGMNQVLEYATGADEMQIYQRSVDKIEVRFVAKGALPPADELALLREFRRRLGPEMTIEFRRVDSIARSASGKFRAVISEVKGESMPPLTQEAGAGRSS